MLTINNLHASVDGREILRGVLGSVFGGRKR